MSEHECSVEGCPRPRARRGLCNMHYKRQQKHGDVGPAETVRPGTLGMCAVEDCEQLTRSSGSRYCEMHYYRLRRTGTTDQLKPWTRHEGPCSVEGCEKPVNDRWGMCKMHAARVARHGDPSVVTHQKDRNLPRGADHARWTGSDASYYAVHVRLKASRGPASDYQCADCGGKAEQWSYDHRDPDERISENGLSYSLDADHYLPRCVSCHKKHDYGVLRRKGALAPEPRCGKPMRARGGSYRVSEVSSSPICGRPEGHNGPCRSAESYSYLLETNRDGREFPRTTEAVTA